MNIKTYQRISRNIQKERIAPRAWFQVMCLVSLVSNNCPASMVANNLSHTLGFKQLVTRACFERQFDLRRLTTVTPLDLSPRNQQRQKSTATDINSKRNQEKQKSAATEINSNSEERAPPRSHQDASWTHRDASWSRPRSRQGVSLLMSVAVSSLLVLISAAIAFRCCWFLLLLISVALDFCCCWFLLLLISVCFAVDFCCCWFRLVLLCVATSANPWVASCSGRRPNLEWSSVMQIWNLAYQGVTHICATHWRGPSCIHCDVLVRVPIDVLKFVMSFDTAPSHARPSMRL